MAELAQRPAVAAAVQFDNRGMRVGGSVYQAARDQYIGSAHAQSGDSHSHQHLRRAVRGSRRWPRPGRASGRRHPALPGRQPPDSPRLRLDQEARRIDAALRQGRHGARFSLAQHWAVRSEDLLDTLLRRRPAIVHFAGHGDDQGQLCLEDAAGRSTPIAPVALARLLAAPGSVRCVVLNACWSDALADALLAVTACVVGMTSNVEDAAAIDFAGGLYRAGRRGEPRRGRGGRPPQPWPRATGAWPTASNCVQRTASTRPPCLSLTGCGSSRTA
ncbi:MAG: CHAT domain-containing protein [Anaerolineae bacterium]|nr:MAG: CHAT domain-containing protein [Anaerolineae bacterium]